MFASVYLWCFIISTVLILQHDRAVKGSCVANPVLLSNNLARQRYRNPYTSVLCLNQTVKNFSGFICRQLTYKNGLCLTLKPVSISFFCKCITFLRLKPKIVSRDCFFFCLLFKELHHRTELKNF
jgi:hypothetical protein